MMKTVFAQWQHHDWWVSEWPNLDANIRLADWAAQEPDGGLVKVVLSAQVATSRWVSLPGVKARHVAKALPFALEEGFIEDIDGYALFAAGQQGDRTRAYVVNASLLEHLMDAFELHHIKVHSVIPETQLLPDGAAIQRWRGGWLVSLPGVLDGWLDDGLIGSALEGSLSSGMLDSISVRAAQLDQAQLLKTAIETGYSEHVNEVIVEATDGVAAARTQLSSAKLVNLLAGRARVQQEDKPPQWWRPIAVMAACLLLTLGTSTWLDIQRLDQQTKDIRKQSVSLYKQLFPGERVRSLERQFRGKLKGDVSTSREGFLSLMNKTAQVYANGHRAPITFESIRFNERSQDLVVELKASSLSELQRFRTALEQAGMKAEVSSASNEKNGVKGRMKIGGAA